MISHANEVSVPKKDREARGVAAALSGASGEEPRAARGGGAPRATKEK